VDRLSLLNPVRLGTLVSQEGQSEVDALDLAECWEQWLWKYELAAFAKATGLTITVCHYPPGDWNYTIENHSIEPSTG